MKVCLVGEQNVGKSCLINSLMNTHVSLVSSKRGSTMENAEAVYSDIQTLKQIHFVDTIGINTYE